MRLRNWQIKSGKKMAALLSKSPITWSCNEISCGRQQEKNGFKCVFDDGDGHVRCSPLVTITSRIPEICKV